jgi:hypothetical protein
MRFAIGLAVLIAIMVAIVSTGGLLAWLARSRVVRSSCG